MRHPLVSVITVTLNCLKDGRKDFLLQNFESVHRQTYDAVEHIVVDGASTDGTVDLLEAFRKNLIRPENEFFCRSNVHGSVTGLKPVRKPSFENVEIESLQHEEQQ